MTQRMFLLVIILIIISLCILVFVLNYENILTVNKQIAKCIVDNSQVTKKQSDLLKEIKLIYPKNDKCESATRDFYRYKCKNMKRVGGVSWALKNSPNDLYRVEGAWFICLDEGLRPINDNCIVLSFGINDDESFDRGMNKFYGCQVESFDPFVEHQLFQAIRRGNAALKDSVTLSVDKKWRFHKMGIVGNNSVKDAYKIGWMATFDQILKYTELTDKIIDVVKIDTEGSEWESIISMNIDYLCKHVKQFMLETHPINWDKSSGITAKHLKILKKLEKCFLLFKRDTRFYAEGHKTEFQQPKRWKVDLNQYNDELDLMDYMIVFGELYFINELFLPKALNNTI